MFWGWFITNLFVHFKFSIFKLYLKLCILVCDDVLPELYVIYLYSNLNEMKNGECFWHTI